MTSLPALDFCYYCRGWIPDWTFPHICAECLSVIKADGQPVTKMFQDTLEKTGDDQA